MIGRYEFYGQWLATDPADFGVYIVCLIVTVLLSLILHECAHGWVALRCGDPTAKMMGRLTLNPLKHLDPIGTVCMFLLGFGWARPVPVNPRNYRDPRHDDFLVSVAGIALNLTLFILCTALCVVGTRVLLNGALDVSIPNVGVAPLLPEELAVEGTEYFQLVGDLIVYGGLQGYAVSSNMPWLLYGVRFLFMMQQINLSLAIFNLLPIPPLDGYRLLNNALRGRLRMSVQVYQVIRFAMLALMLTGWLGRGLSVVTGTLNDAVTGLFLMV